jgi:hypothetical protein
MQLDISKALPTTTAPVVPKVLPADVKKEERKN